MLMLALTTKIGKDILNKIFSDCSGDDRVAYIHKTLEAVAITLKDRKIALTDLAITKILMTIPIKRVCLMFR